MQFGVIYTAEAERLRPHIKPPPSQLNRKLWKRTEKGQSESIPSWKAGKWIACLTLRQFRSFVNHCGIFAEKTETEGSLGCPLPNGEICYGILPAISFRDDERDRMLNAYVTPFPEPGDEALVPGLVLPKGERVIDEDGWQLIRRWILETWQ